MLRNVFKSAMLALVMLGSLAAPAALAARGDVELLQSYIGNWKGRGTLTGGDSESVVCRLTLSPGNDDKVNYSGKCAMAGTNVAVNGTLLYNEAKARYEAAMTSNVTFTGLAIGKKQGNAVVFNLREQNKDENGEPLTITADIVLKPEAISVAFKVIFNNSGKTLAAQVPFTR